MAVPTAFADNKLPFDSGDMRGELRIFDLLNQQRTAQVGRNPQSGMGQYTDSFLQPIVSSHLATRSCRSPLISDDSPIAARTFAGRVFFPIKRFRFDRSGDTP
ncbi:hypothetical protein [Rhodanobacter koreensis]